MLESELNASDQDPLLFLNIYDRFYLVQSSYELVAVTIGPGGMKSFQYVIILLFVWAVFVIIILVPLVLLCNPIYIKLSLLVTLRNDHNHNYILYTSQQYIIGSIFKAVQHWLRKNLASIRYKIGKKKI